MTRCWTLCKQIDSILKARRWGIPQRSVPVETRLPVALLSCMTSLTPDPQVALQCVLRQLKLAGQATPSSLARYAKLLCKVPVSTGFAIRNIT